MKTQPVVPAKIEFGDDGLPWAPDFGDRYHARAGALAQARHVFLGGNRLPARWQGRERFVVLETGFGLGNNFLATWDSWRNDASRCERLVYVAIEKHPPRLADLRRAHEASPLRPLADQLAGAWPSLTPNLHPLAFEHSRVRLLLALGDVADWLHELVLEADAFYLDGFAPARNPQMWDRHVFKALGRRAAPGATAATWSVARPVRDGLAEAGFVVERQRGFADKGEMTVARFEPAFTPRRAPSRVQAVPRERHAIVVGAGLAGAWTAHELQAEGWQCTVIDRHADPAAETSGNPAGLFHGVVTPEDGAHARFNRAAALHAERSLRPRLGGEVPGRLEGLLRMVPGADAHGLRAQLARLGLPPDHVQALDAAEASALAGWPLSAPAWFYPGGGWLAPAPLARALLQGCDRLVASVHGLRESAGGWQALDARGHVLAEAPVVVLANAADALRLLDHPDWPLSPVRGQLSVMHTDAELPKRPIAGSGYAIPLPPGRLLFGATSHPDDGDPLLRQADHDRNLLQLGTLLGRAPEPLGPLAGRVGWRLMADDRLPVLGPVPHPAAEGRLDQPRFVPRRAGLYVLTALGSRGITWAPLAARVLAAWVAGAPLPLEASLLDVVDVARFTSRVARRSGAKAPR